MSMEAKVVSQQIMEYFLKIKVDSTEIRAKLYWNNVWFVRPACNELSVAELIAVCKAIYDSGLVKQDSRLDVMVDETKGSAYAPCVSCKDSVETDLLASLKIPIK